MNKKVRQKIVIFLGVLFFFFGYFGVAFAQEGGAESAEKWTLVPIECRGDADISTCNLSSVEKMIGNVGSLILGFSGILALIVFVLSGIKMMIARGNSSKINEAKSALVKAVIGLFLVVFSGAIIRVLLKVLSGKVD